MKIKKALELLLIALILMTFTSCSSSGGGVGGSGVVSKGTITEKGSIFVNGVEFDTTGAVITTDDNPDRTEDDLDLGMVVTVKGTVNADGFTGTVDSIEFEDNLEGPVTIDNDSTKTVIVLGQTVVWNSSTICENDATIKCDSLVVGNLVEVSGFPSGPNSILATRIEAKDPVFDPINDKVELKGAVGSLDTTAKTFKIGGQEIHYTINTVFEGVTENTLEGSFVEVKGNLDPPLIVLTADKIELEVEGLEAEEGKEVEIEGLVTDCTAPCTGSDLSFKVNGQLVQTNSGTEFKNVTIANNVRIEVEGIISTGILIAREVSPR